MNTNKQSLKANLLQSSDSSLLFIINFKESNTSSESILTATIKCNDIINAVSTDNPLIVNFHYNNEEQCPDTEIIFYKYKSEPINTIGEFNNIGNKIKIYLDGELELLNKPYESVELNGNNYDVLSFSGKYNEKNSDGKYSVYSVNIKLPLKFSDLFIPEFPFVIFGARYPMNIGDLDVNLKFDNDCCDFMYRHNEESFKHVNVQNSEPINTKKNSSGKINIDCTANYDAKNKIFNITKGTLSGLEDNALFSFQTQQLVG
jgi:hypothetical protein